LQKNEFCINIKKLKMKINLKNFKVVLKREEMREIKAGGGGFAHSAPPDEPGTDECKSTCTPDNDTCAEPGCPNSYCATYHCGPSNIRINSCQYQ
jgi:hypothetical protein